MDRYIQFTRLNEQGDEGGSLWLSPDAVVAVLGEETATAVRVVTAAGVEYRLAQPRTDAEGKEQPSVLARLQGGR